MMDKELLDALKVILEKTQWMEDEGPIGEGWQSDALSNALAVAQRFVDEACKEQK